MTKRHQDIVVVGSRTIRTFALGPLAGVRELRGVLFECCVWLRAHPDGWTVIFDASQRMPKDRIRAELDDARQIINAASGERLLHLRMRGSTVEAQEGWPSWLGIESLGDHIRRDAWARHSPARSAFCEVLMVLVQDLLGGRAVRTRAQLGALSGLSYPAIARALHELGSVVDQRYRSLKLLEFPRSAWDRIFAMRVKWRKTLAYCVGAGLPFKPDQILHRLRKQGLSHVALGGVVGARTYGSIDLVGVPRIDLTQVAPHGDLDVGWLQQVAPELRPSTPSEPTHLVIHAVRRADTLFRDSKHGLVADPAEILLDLQDLRLDEQAATFLDERLSSNREGRGDHHVDG